MSLKVLVFSDYVCPYCILAEGELERAAANKGVEIEYMPFELRPYPTPTLRPEGEYMQKDWAERVYPLAEQLGVKIVMPPFSPQPYTHLAFEGYQYAIEQGKAKEYNRRMYKAFFQDSLDIGDIDVLTQLAGEIGLNQEEYREALVTRKYKEKHQAALDYARNVMKIHAAPTYVIGDTVIKGMAFQAQFEEVIEKELLKRKLQKLDIEGMACGPDGCYT